MRWQRVLVVDDNLTNRKVLTGQLHRLGTQAVCAGYLAADALALDAGGVRRRPAVRSRLGFDHQMPDCDGAEPGSP